MERNGEERLGAGFDCPPNSARAEVMPKDADCPDQLIIFEGCAQTRDRGKQQQLLYAKHRASQ